jgi:hypothetical protein
VGPRLAERRITRLGDQGSKMKRLGLSPVRHLRQTSVTPLANR